MESILCDYMFTIQGLLRRRGLKIMHRNIPRATASVNFYSECLFRINVYACVPIQPEDGFRPFSDFTRL